MKNCPKHQHCCQGWIGSHEFAMRRCQKEGILKYQKNWYCLQHEPQILPVISKIKEVLRQRGRNWEIITPNQDLKNFLRRGGDYIFWIDDSSIGKNQIESGGNEYWWKFKNDNVHLIFQHVKIPKTNCIIKLNVFLEILKNLETSRKH